MEMEDAFNSKQYETALKYLDEIEQYVGVTEMGLYYKTQCHYHLSQFLEAKKNLDKYLAYDPKGDEFMVIMKLAGKINSEYEKARRESEDYIKALNTQSLYSYESFLKKYPDSQHYGKIHDLYEESLYKKGKNEGDVTLLKRYLTEFPKGKYASIAQEEYDYLMTKKAHNLGDYASFKEKYPKSDHIEEIDEILAEGYLYWGDRYMNEKLYYKAVDNYNSYLKEYSEKRQEVNEKIQKALYMQAEKAHEEGNYSSAIVWFKRYLREYPGGYYSERASARLKEYDREAFLNAQRENTVSAYRSYLYNNPEGEYRDEANSAISGILHLEKVTRQVEKALFGEEPNGFCYYLDFPESFSSAVFTFYAQTDSPFGFSFSFFGYNMVENQYLGEGFTMPTDITAYLGVNGGLGLHLRLGYQIDFIGHRSSDSYFNTTGYSNDSFYDPGDLRIHYRKFHYGFGYQNAFGPIFLGVSYEWVTRNYKADPSNLQNYEGLDVKSKGSMVSVSFGFYVDY
jgi:outer membrane protein assembly factor BamD (BamD/ComL family)